MLTVVSEVRRRPRWSHAGGSRSLIDEIVRDGARRMLAAALHAEVEVYIAGFRRARWERPVVGGA